MIQPSNMNIHPILVIQDFPSEDIRRSDISIDCEKQFVRIRSTRNGRYTSMFGNDDCIGITPLCIQFLMRNRYVDMIRSGVSSSTLVVGFADCLTCPGVCKDNLGTCVPEVDEGEDLVIDQMGGLEDETTFSDSSGSVSHELPSSDKIRPASIPSVVEKNR
jgi:hypothetical protein